MAQKIDTSEFSDQFTDGTVRYSASGIDRVARSNWSFSLTHFDGLYTVRVFLNGTLANINAASTTPLSSTGTVLRLMQSSTQLASVAASAWVNVTTGIYTVDLRSFIAQNDAYTVELNAQATFTNPVVSGKTSILTDASASYPSELITVNWLATSDALRTGQTPIFDGVDFALNGNIAFR